MSKPAVRIYLLDKDAPPATTVTLVLDGPRGFLMQHRTEINPETGKPPRYAGAWCFPGEEKLQGESDEEAVIRCAFEELGMRIPTTPAQVYDILTYEHDGDIDRVFVVKYDDQPIVVKEGKAMEWKTPAEIHKIEATGRLGFRQEAILLPVFRFVGNKDVATG